MMPAIACVIVGTLVACTGLPPHAQRPDPGAAAATLQARTPPYAPHPQLRNAWGDLVVPGMAPAVDYGAPAPAPQVLPDEPSPNAIPPYPLGLDPWAWPYQGYGYGLPSRPTPRRGAPVRLAVRVQAGPGPAPPPPSLPVVALPPGGGGIAAPPPARGRALDQGGPRNVRASDRR